MSLTCVVCKLLESFIRDVIVDHMNKYNIYSNCQHGFRKRRSCVTQLMQVMEDFTQFIENKSAFDVIYLDFQKAFDQVPHQRLLKLSAQRYRYALFAFIHTQTYFEYYTLTLRLASLVEKNRHLCILDDGIIRHLPRKCFIYGDATLGC